MLVAVKKLGRVVRDAEVRTKLGKLFGRRGDALSPWLGQWRGRIAWNSFDLEVVLMLLLSPGGYRACACPHRTRDRASVCLGSQCARRRRSRRTSRRRPRPRARDCPTALARHRLEYYYPSRARSRTVLASTKLLFVTSISKTMRQPPGATSDFSSGVGLRLRLLAQDLDLLAAVDGDFWKVGRRRNPPSVADHTTTCPFIVGCMISCAS